MAYFVSEGEASASSGTQRIELDTKGAISPLNSCVDDRSIWNNLNPQQLRELLFRRHRPGPIHRILGARPHFEIGATRHLDLDLVRFGVAIAGPEGTDVKDGDIITACQQACPTNAISFGNLLEPDAGPIC